MAALPADEFLAGESAAGRPLGHVHIDLLTECNTLCRAGERGRIRLSGGSLFKAYRGRLGGGLNADGMYMTDDEGCFDAQGRLHIIGRRDRLIISGGEKIDPLEVERALRRTGAVDEVLVLGWPDPEWGHQLVAFYTRGSNRRECVDCDLVVAAPYKIKQ